jgi:hypothetical protein
MPRRKLWRGGLQPNGRPAPARTDFGSATAANHGVDASRRRFKEFFSSLADGYSPASRRTPAHFDEN